jgi:trimethyllysine dioxygenase
MSLPFHSASARRSGSAPLIKQYETSESGRLLTLAFSDDSAFTFHSQWLHDARCDNGSSRDATTAFCQTLPTARIEAVHCADQQGTVATLDVTWSGGAISHFPALWLRAIAPVVAQSHQPSVEEQKQQADLSSSQPGWLSDVQIPEVRYNDLFPDTAPPNVREAATARVLDLLLAYHGIVRIAGAPPANLEEESKTENTQVTRVLGQLFGSVSRHPRRAADTSFNVASIAGENPNPVALSNYSEQEAAQVLLPHGDHAHYLHPAQVMAFSTPQGVSDNTFVSVLAVIRTLRQEAPQHLDYLLHDPVAVGRSAHYYSPPLDQAVVDTVITPRPGFPSQVKLVRWHPHFFGSCLSPFDRRPSHQLTLRMGPGDMYLWNNHLVLHGRERIVQAPRLGVGQTVPEEVVAQRYRELKIAALLPHIDRKWLVHAPTPQLQTMIDLLPLVQSESTKTAGHGELHRDVTVGQVVC